MRAALRLALLIAVLAVPDRASAQAPLSASEEQLVNYAFATQLGSGVYDVSGRTLQIYRLPFGHTFTQPSGTRPGIRLTLPLTIGFADFKPRDVLDTGLPTDLDTLSFVPGIELDFALTPRWHLLPFAEAGRTWDLGGDSDATVYSFGAHLLGLISWSALDLRFDFGAIYAAVEPRAELPSDDVVVLELGIEARHGLGLTLAGNPLDWGAYLLSQSFINRADEPVDRAPEQADHYQFETGVTIGPRSKMTVWRIPVPRLGLGYRFGNDLGVWRLVIGAPF
jgi:hypothetical protein